MYKMESMLRSGVPGTFYLLSKFTSTKPSTFAGNPQNSRGPTECLCAEHACMIFVVHEEIR